MMWGGLTFHGVGFNTVHDGRLRSTNSSCIFSHLGRLGRGRFMRLLWRHDNRICSCRFAREREALLLQSNNVLSMASLQDGKPPFSPLETELVQNSAEVKTQRKEHGKGRSFLSNKSSSMHPNDMYTQDGSTDIGGNPAVKSKSGNWKACWFLLGNQCWERLAYYGISTNMVNYLITRLHQGNSTAANTVTNWTGTCYITPLIGAFMADSYWGRYWTIAIFSIVAFVGLTLLILSASLPQFKSHCKHEDVNCHASTAQMGFFFFALYLISLGIGGMKPCVTSFGADQFDEADKIEKIRKSSFFNWLYFSINIGGLLAAGFLVWVQENVGWGLGFGIPTMAMGMAICSFFSGTCLYRYQKAGGSALTRIAQVIVASIRKWQMQVPDADHLLLYEVQDNESSVQVCWKMEHTDGFSFLDKAALETEYDRSKVGPINPWRLCTVTQVEELKSIIRILPIWATGIVFNTVFSQIGSLFVEQGDTMDPRIGPHFKIPAASLTMFNYIGVIFWVPVYDRLIVPIARKYTGHQMGFTQLQRMGIGLVISILSMVIAAIVEVKRLDMVKKHNYYELKHVPMSIFWQIPQQFLIGAAEVFTSIGQLEFFYDQAPDAMRSVCSALSLTTMALGNYLSTLLVTIVTHITTRNGKKGWIPNNLNYGHVDYFFWLLAILSVMNFLVYIAIAHWYTYKRPAKTLHIRK